MVVEEPEGDSHNPLVIAACADHAILRATIHPPARRGALARLRAPGSHAVQADHARDVAAGTVSLEMPRAGNAPIVIFAYKRPAYLSRAIESLKQCAEFDASAVYVFVDGPKRSGEGPLVEQAYRVAREQLPGAIVVRRSQNLGLARSVSAGVAQVCQAHGRAIVVEDDLVVSPGFLAFLNAALDRYESTERVMHVSAYMYPTPSSQTAVDASFLPTIGSWGWATWQRAWKQYDEEARGWEALEKDPALRARFDLEGDADFSSMLYAQMAGHIDSWVIRWYWTVF